MVEFGLNICKNIHFKPDVALSHYANVVCYFLDEKFSQRWIGKGWIEGLSTTLTQSYIFRLLWGILKKKSL